MDQPQLDQQLVDAAEKGNLRQVKHQIRLGANPNAYYGKALRLASRNGYTSVVKCLIDHGADLHVWNSAAFWYAIYNSHFEVIRLMLDHGVNQYARNGALSFVINNGYIEVVRLLVYHSADIHVKNDRAIRFAYTSKYTNIVNLLLSHYKPRKDNSAFTAMIIINNYKLTKKYNKYLSNIVNYEINHWISINPQISKYIIRNTSINNQWLANAIYSKNYHIHRVKIATKLNRLHKQYKN